MGGKDEVQNVAAGLELVAGDHRVGDDDRDGGEHAGRGVVARLQQVRHRELRKAASAAGDRRDHDQSAPIRRPAARARRSRCDRRSRPRRTGFRRRSRTTAA